MAATGRVMDLAQRLRSLPPALAGPLWPGAGCRSAPAGQRPPSSRWTCGPHCHPSRLCWPAAEFPDGLAGMQPIDVQCALGTGPWPRGGPNWPDQPATGAEFWDPAMTGPRFVPADLTKDHAGDDQGVVESLRSGALGAEPTGCAEQAQLGG